MLLVPSVNLVLRTLQNIRFQAFCWWSEDLSKGVRIVLHLEITIQDGSSWNFSPRDVEVDSMGNHI